MQTINKIAVIGGGNIGTAIITGLTRSGVFKKSDITVTRLPSQSLTDLQKEGFNATHSNIEAISNAEMIIVAVQPRQAKQIFAELKEHIDHKKQTVVSIVSGLAIEDIEKHIGGKTEVIRVMPNTAIAVCESMTCMASKNTSSKRFEEVKAIFCKVGKVLVIDEKLMASATVLAACGTGFFLRIIRAASQGGIQVGFHADEAQLIAAQVAKGATTLVLETGNHPEAEIDKVTTPMGLTIKGLNEMEHNGLSSAIIKGIVHSYTEMDKLTK